MSPIKQKIIDDIIEREGGYVDDPADSGGETNFGITIKVARAHGYAGPMKNLPRDVAVDIYSERYWDALNLDFIELKSPSTAEELADTGVNMGIGRAGVFLQRALNSLNHAGKYPALVLDGGVGPKTIEAFNKYMEWRGAKGELVLVRLLNCQQGFYYMELAEKRPKDKKFLYGWLLNRVK